MIKYLIIPFIVLVLACASEKVQTQKSESDSQSTELPLPSVPSTLTTPEERAAYIVAHFWDALDMTRPEQKGDTALMEQTFSNYLSILPYATERDAAASIAALISKCSADPSTVRLIEKFAGKYLDDPNSPMRSEDIFILFLRGFIGETSVPTDVVERSRYGLECALKNRPGDKASNFRMVTRSGKKTSLHEAVKGDTTLVVFYDPDCTHCREITAHLASGAVPIPYPVVAIDVAGDRAKWDSSKDSLPAAWTVTFATDPVEDKEIYIFPALPSLYLLAPDATVILKDFPVP